MSNATASINIPASGPARISFRYDPAKVAAVKALPGRRFDGSTKTWTVPVSDGLAALAESWSVTPYDPHGRLTPEPAIPAMVEEPLDVPGTDSTNLRPHQAAVVASVQAGRRHVLLTDEPGLGKTATALVSAAAAGSTRTVVICPAVVKVSWARESLRWWPAAGEPTIITGRKAVDLPSDGGLVVINFDILSAHADALAAWNPSAVVVDEGHYIKDRKAARSKAAFTVAEACSGLVMVLTGTPMTARVIDLAGPLTALGWLDAFGGFWRFARRYAGAVEGRFGWEMDGAENLDELHEKLAGLGMVRRVKADVADLPDRDVIDLPVALNGAGVEYRKAERELVATITDEVKAAAKKRRAKADWDLVVDACREHARLTGARALGELVQAAGLAKVPAVIEHTGSLLQSGPVVVMAHHVEVQERIADGLAEAGHRVGRIYGGQGADDRQSAVDEFQAGGLDVLVCSITAAGVGITLTAASRMVLAELPWTAAAQDQAIDRIHRIGQDADVTAWRLLADETPDAVMAARIRDRAVMSAAVVDGQDIDLPTTSIAEAYLAPLVAKKLRIKRMEVSA